MPRGIFPFFTCISTSITSKYLSLEPKNPVSLKKWDLTAKVRMMPLIPLICSGEAPQYSLNRSISLGVKIKYVYQTVRNKKEYNFRLNENKQIPNYWVGKSKYITFTVLAVS